MNWPVVAALVLVLQVPSLPIVMKFSGPSLGILVALVAVVILAGAVWFAVSGRGRLYHALANPLWGLAALVLLTVMIAIAYPILDARKALGVGSDQDDCVLLIAGNILSGLAPYACNHSYFGNPCSTGLGMVLPALPLAIVNAYPFGISLALAGCAALLERLLAGGRAANLFLLLFLLSPELIRQALTGSDYPLIGCGALAAVLMLRRGGGWIWGGALLLGMVAASRVPLLYLVFLPGFLLWSVDRRQAVQVTLLAILIGGGLTAAGYLPDPTLYSPLHVLRSAKSGLSSVSSDILAASLCFAGTVVLVLLARHSSLAGWLAAAAVALVVPLAIPVLAPLADGRLRLNDIGAITIAGPMIAAWAAAHLNGYRRPQAIKNGLR